jgi:hypothetical protein
MRSPPPLGQTRQSSRLQRSRGDEKNQTRIWTLAALHRLMMGHSVAESGFVKRLMSSAGLQIILER